MNGDEKHVKCFERLWAPWRMTYINSMSHECESEECIFCTKPKEDTDDENFILHRGEHCFVIMNLFPYNNGHLLIVPYKHTAEFSELDEPSRKEMLETIDLIIEAFRCNLRPEGFNIGLNLGRAAGAGITDHIHIHMVPRWTGDTNFLPVIGGTKVISEYVGDTYRRLKESLMQIVNNSK